MMYICGAIARVRVTPLLVKGAWQPVVEDKNF